MDRFQQLRVFVAVAEEEGFAAAARRLRTSPPVVTRAISALEESLGVQLLQRTTRSVRVTETGQRFLEDARQVLESLEAAEQAATGINANPKGQLSVTAPVLFGKKYVMPVIVEFLQRYPDTTANALFVDRIVNLIEEGQDVGVRIGELPDSTLRARQVGEVSSVLVASRDYLDLNGTPGSLADLKQSTLIASSAGDFPLSWRFANSTEPFRVKPKLVSSTNDAAIEAATLGLGIARLISYQVSEQLASGELIRVLPDQEPPPLPVHVVHRQGRFSPARTRAFIDMMVDNLTLALQ